MASNTANRGAPGRSSSVSSGANAMASVYIGEETVPKNLVGSIKAGTVDYIRDMKAFDPQLIPPEVRAKVLAVRKFVEKDMLGTKAKEWTTSTYVDRMKEYERQIDFEAWKFQTRAGLLDHREPDGHPPKTYPGCERRDLYRDWNVSNEVSQRELKKRLIQMTEEYKKLARAHSAKALSSYKNPVALQNELSSAIRKQKEDDEGLRESLRKDYVYAHPTASSEKVNANVFRLASLTKLKQKQATLYSQEVPSKFKPDLSKTLTSRRMKEYSHNGAWQVYPPTGKQCWSCCLSEEETAIGCVVKITEKDRWNVQGFTTS